MKKNLFFVFTMLCALSFFTACSDDDDNSWQELPKGYFCDLYGRNIEIDDGRH